MAKKKQKQLKAKGSLIGAKQETRTTLHVTSKTKDILKSLFDLPVQSDWLDDDAIDKINRDSTVTAAIGSRKAATLKKEIIVTCKNEDIKKNIENIFHYDLLDSILDTPYQGFGTFELNWTYKDYIWYPKLIERDYKGFLLNNSVLKFSANGLETEIPPYKALHATYKAKPKKPYGQPLYNPLFWLIEFKNGSMEFWIDLLERFGTPWVIAKTDDNKNALADEIYNMLGGDGAVLGLEDSLDIKTADKSGDFKGIIEYLDNQIREIILGGNLTGQVTGGSQAAATVHNDIREDLAMADEHILRNIIKTTITYFKEVNDFKDELIIELKDKDDPNIELSTRDKIIYEMGYRPKKEYIQKTYSIEVDDISQNNSAPISNALKVSEKVFAFSKDKPADTLDGAIDSISLKKIELTFQKQIIDILDGAETFEEAIEALQEAYPKTELQELQELMESAMINAEILARVEVEDESEEK